MKLDLPNWFLFFPMVQCVFGILMGTFELPKIIAKLKTAESWVGKVGRPLEFLVMILMIAFLGCLLWACYLMYTYVPPPTK